MTQRMNTHVHVYGCVHPPPLRRYAELERTLGEAQRTRAIYELAIAQPVLDMPEALWKVGLGLQSHSCVGGLLST